MNFGHLHQIQLADLLTQINFSTVAELKKTLSSQSEYKQPPN